MPVMAIVPLVTSRPCLRGAVAEENPRPSVQQMQLANSFGFVGWVILTVAKSDSLVNGMPQPLSLGRRWPQAA